MDILDWILAISCGVFLIGCDVVFIFYCIKIIKEILNNK